MLDRRLLIVTGKGGAGKSVLSLALAHRLSAAGRRVWLVELGRKRDREFTRLPGLVGKDKLGHEPTEVTLPGTKEKILVSVLDPTTSLAEYVDLKLPTGGLAGILLNNRVTASFLEVVPGLPDLVQLGKLWYALTQAKNGPDVVVLDAPATGHALALLRAPENFRRITRMGPIYKDALQMTEFLADEKATGIVLAALPEEMAVKETQELQKFLGKDFPKPAIYVNKVFPILAPQKESGDNVVWRAYSYAKARGSREHEAASSLKGARILPFLFPEPKAAPLFLRLSELLE
jgi:anion-transporting  ArsA/GET3 family ATPase